MKQNKIVVADKGWAETIPEWLKKEVEGERLMNSMVAMMEGKEQKVGDAEACLYLCTLALSRPLDSDDCQIYMYLSTKLTGRNNIQLPKELIVESLTEYQERLLNDLKYNLYKKRGGEIESPLLAMLKVFKASA